MPLVLEGDRLPQRPRDACGNCLAKIGESHMDACIFVHKLVVIRVTVAVLVAGRRSIRGEWTAGVPFAWTSEDIEFRFGESTWCASNLSREKHAIVWENPSVGEHVYREFERLKLLGSCPCGNVECKFLRVADPEPRRSRPETYNDGTN